MNRYQEDILEIYNSLTILDETLPVVVSYNKDLKSVYMKQRGIIVNIPLLNHYCFKLNKIKKTILLPKDFDSIMGQMKKLIESGITNYDRILISPEDYGFRVFRRVSSLNYEPIEVADIQIVTSNWWLFRLIIKFKYRKYLR